MYEGLETNLPHMLMQYSDAPFPEGTQLFPRRDTVMQYLEDYARDLVGMIKFGHRVVDIAPTAKEGCHSWTVTVKAGDGEERSTAEVFDAVIAANGHCDWPLLPPIEGLDEWSKMFPESLHHSVSYKNAKAFKDQVGKATPQHSVYGWLEDTKDFTDKSQRVLLVGGGPSAADIGQQIGSVCKHPLIVAEIEKSPYHTDQPYTKEHPALVALNPHERAATFKDGSVEHDIDAILLCTGYAYRFPFLKSIAPAVIDEGIRALPLYQHIFHERHPTLAFIETPEMIVPFPLAECQAAVIARVWSNRLALPSLQEMHKWREGILGERGAGRAFHALKSPLDLEYMNEMYAWSNEATELPNSEHGVRGKLPKQWDDEACWLRMTAPKMKKAFNVKGEHRANVPTYEELGFRFGDEEI